MKIEIAVEGKNNTVFDWNVSSFPGRFTFLDRTSKVLIEVNIDLEAFEILVRQIERKVNLSKVHPWTCEKCGELNYMLAKYCHKCAAPKPVIFIPREDIPGEAEIYEKKDSME